MKKKNISFWLLLPAMALLMGACGESDKDDPDNPETPITPVTPVNPGDWQTVPAAGGTIEKGDIALTFPAGTFDSDTKVAIQAVKKGSIGGDCEASPFYQLTLNTATKKPFSVKMKVADTDDGRAEFVVQSPGYSISQCQYVTNESAIETSYSKGAYTATIPTINEIEDKSKANITIGLCRNPYESTAGARIETRADDQIEDQVDNVKWTLKINYWTVKSDKYQTIKRRLSDVNKFIKEAITKIHELGITIPGNVTLHYQICPFWFVGANGSFSPSFLSRDYDCISIKDEIVTWVGEDDTIIQTILHETLHNYQSYYHPGSTPNPTFDNNAMYEMGAIWIEKFALGGKLDDVFQLTDNGLHTTFENNFRIGMPRYADEVMGLYSDLSPYAEMGYAAGPLLYYMISKNYSRGFTDKTIASLYTKYWKKIKEDYILIEILKEWYSDTFKENFFDGTDNINNYYLALWKGELMDNFIITKLENQLKSKKADYLSEKNTKLSLRGTVYPYGCEGMLFKMDANGFTESKLRNQEMVIKQDYVDVKTYLIYNDGTRIMQYPKTATKGDSVSIPGDFIADLHKRNNYNTTFFLLNVKGKYSFKNKMDMDESPNKTQTSVEMREDSKVEAEPTELTFEAEGGSKDIQVTVKNFNYYGAYVDDDGKGWVSVATAKNNGLQIVVTTTPNTTKKERTCTVYVYAYNEETSLETVKKVPVKVTQKAGSQQISQVKISSVAFKTRMWTNVKVYHHYWGSTELTGQYSSDAEGCFTESRFTEKYISCSFSGSSLHADIDYENRGDHHILSFDVTGIKGDYKEARVTNLTWKRVYLPESVFGYDNYNISVSYSNIPIKKVYLKNASDPMTLNELVFDGNVANGMGVSGYKSEKYTNDGWGGYHQSLFEYLNNGENFANLEIVFESVK